MECIIVFNYEVDIISDSYETDMNEEKFMNKILSLIEKIDFSKINYHHCMGWDEASIIGRAVGLGYNSCIEFLLKKYHETGANISKRRYGNRASCICDLMNTAIYTGNYDGVEILLRYVKNINELNGGGESYMCSAKYGPSRNSNGDIIELLEMHGAI